MAQVMAVDYGTRRVGVAVSDPDGRYALPLTILEVPARARAAAVAGLAAERGVQIVVVGRPVRARGEDSALWPEISAFAKSLERRGLTVVYEDEAYTSDAAEEEERAAGARRPGRARNRVDAQAARLILERYLQRAGA
jgi:putative Holliday junction resolvase